MSSTSYEDFARKWNVPVHRFLRFHVYLQTIRSFNLSKSQASILTFLVSSIFHELVMCVMLGSGPYFYLFFLQMLQLPLIWIGSLPVIQRHPAMANLAFWVSLTMGPPLLTVAYAREHYRNAAGLKL